MNMFSYTYITVMVGVGQIVTGATGPRERSRTENEMRRKSGTGTQIGRYVKGVPDIGSGGLISQRMTRYVRYKKDVDMKIDVDAQRSAVQSSALRKRTKRQEVIERATGKER